MADGDGGGGGGEKEAAFAVAGDWEVVGGQDDLWRGKTGAFKGRRRYICMYKHSCRVVPFFNCLYQTITY